MPRFASLAVVGVLTGILLSAAGAADRLSAADGKVAFPHARLAQQSLEKHIRPGYRRFAEATKKLDDVVATDCALAGGAARRKVGAAFDEVVTAWGNVEHIAFGPVTVEQRYERIMFWPDRRGIGARQVAKALADHAPDVLDAKRLAEKSVAMQGLPALEAVLFGEASTGAEDGTAYRCGFAKAIASNLKGMARSIVDEWDAPNGFSKSWLSPNPADPHFLKPEETTMALAKAFDRGLEKVRDQRLAGPMGLNTQRRKIAPPLRKSNRSMRLIVANIVGLRDLYVGGGLEQALIEAAGDPSDNSKELAQLVSKELATAGREGRELLKAKSPFEGAASQRIIALGFPLKNARTTAAEMFASVTDLPLGFNASDGD
ncbi:MAG: imelysin family protein [Hyphomicrobiaceae bacterium]